MSRDMLCIADFQGYFRRLNPAWEETLGYPLQELLSRPYVDFVHPDDRNATSEEAKSNTTGEGTLLFENRYRRKDGSYRWLAWKTAPLVEEGLIYAIARDVTDQKQAALELLQARETAEAASRAKSEFVANMSHEIRTPINAVLGLTDLVLRTSLEPRQQDYLRKVKLAADALLQLVDRILDFTKLEASRLELEAAPFVLPELLEQVSAIVAEKARQKGLGFRVQCDAGVPPRLVGDVQRLRQVLINLLSNAVKFTAAGEVCLSVAHDDAAADATARCRLRFAVRDTGIGLSAAQVARLFQPFTQAGASTSRKYGGTGLGLAISKRLTEAMGGELSVESAPARGSTFRMKLPLEALPDTLAAVPAATAAAPPVPLAGKVLLVEDNLVNRMLAVAMLDKLGIAVTEADDGLAALRHLEASRFDLVLMDCQLPVMDGFEATREIRARERGASAPRTPIIAVTANALSGDSERCLQAGMDGYLAKPYTLENLRETLTPWLGKGA
jgi:PAS domain S-box-containing protein